ncbi:peptidase U34 [Lactobacillus agilis] [Lactiplantibacillus mudanjiangensis]|uniref:C69 family dipeptidase n=1 Tax=Lactiplantibacillus mudanjiangensis TaxID=1296538 RepID=UPI0010150B89|nr:C69 family dipeptidase [Lactiplantibacillus mudanjiangensis]VDG30841.1 peptidase U34 [Lactobacillus agilis] [Lactiplantibacillus mudanjiangensis]
MACTTFLVGKNASVDGSTMIARAEDGGDGPNPQKFVVVTPDQQPKTYHAILTSVTVPLPASPLSYTATPDVDSSAGIWAGAGINGANVAMTATETITTNSRVQGADPFVANGLGEADFLTIVLPYIHSARAGVQRLGALLEKYGTYEANGIAFSDCDEVWYMETLGGHHWAAMKIPDDAYVIAPNRLNIDQFDIKSDMTLCSADLEAFIVEHHLNPDLKGLNLRHTFGSATIKDTAYNNPRAWYVQQHFTPTSNRTPIDQELPFIQRASRKLTVSDVKWALSSHYQNTPFDPYGHGSSIEKEQYRAIALNRNLETHVLQIRNHVPADLAGVHWLAFGPNTFNELAPFYAHVTDTPMRYRDTPTSFDAQTIFWLNKTLALMGDRNFELYQELVANFQEQVMAKMRSMLLSTKPTDNLEAVNERIAETMFADAMALLGKMTVLGSQQMKLSYDLLD